MDIIFELIMDLLLEGSVEASKSKKVPKIIRYILIVLIVLFFLFVIGLVVLLGVDCLKKNLIGGIIVILIGVLLLVLSILKFKKIYLEKSKN